VLYDLATNFDGVHHVSCAPKSDVSSFCESGYSCGDAFGVNGDACGSFLF